MYCRRLSHVMLILAVLIFSTEAAVPQRHRSVHRPPVRKATPVLDQATKDAILAAHNQYRATKNLAPLSWSDELSGYAQEWADYLATHGCRMQHRPQDGTYKQLHSENLFMATVGFYTAADGVAAWWSEKKLYHNEAIQPNNFHPYGHYTQLMWSSTTKVGAGIAVCGDNFILVCNYDPPGNVIGQKPY